MGTRRVPVTAHDLTDVIEAHGLGHHGARYIQGRVEAVAQQETVL